MARDDSPSSPVLGSDITAEHFDYVAGLVRQRTGLVLDRGKEYLLRSRLLPLVRRQRVASLSGFIASLMSTPFGVLHADVVEALLTNETFFFRDVHPFQALKDKVIPEVLTKNASTRSLSIWSAACASGQEPYSIAMLLDGFAPRLSGWSVRLLATDFSERMLARTREGIFSQLEMNRGLEEGFRSKYFRPVGEHGWQAREDLRRRVEVRRLNLAAPWVGLPKFDIVFIRNVLIYFDAGTKSRILGQLEGVMNAGGYLFLGAAETVVGQSVSFERVQVGLAGFYQLRQVAPRA